MQLHFGKLFQEATKNIAPGEIENLSTSSVVEVPPVDAPALGFKEYLGFTEILLPPPSLELTFLETIKHLSLANTPTQLPLTLQELSNLLFFSCGSVHKALNRNLSRRAQISIGNKYPLEIYLINFIEGDLEKRIYHYRPEEHSFDELWKLDFFPKEKVDTLFKQGLTPNLTVSCAIIITAVIDRVVPFYGDRAYRYLYLEAGAIANTLNMIGNTGNLHCSVYENFYDKDFEEILDIDGEFETVLTSIVINK